MIIVSKNNCTFCKMALRALELNGVEHKVIKLEDDPEYLDILSELGIRTVPAVFLGEPSLETYLGGYHELRDYIYKV